ncbi:MAG: hypothetical protein WDO56_15630 [Gammaproteobacteria bacterium]
MNLTLRRIARTLAAAGVMAVLFLSTAHIVMASTKDSTDPFLWLEDIEDDRALTWVRAQNERSLKQLTSDPRYERFNKAALAILEDKSRIPLGSLRDGWVYNFWQDDVNVRGLWRRASRASYETQSPEWQTLLDLDALAKKEERNWVWKGVSCVLPAGRAMHGEALQRRQRREPRCASSTSRNASSSPVASSCRRRKPMSPGRIRTRSSWPPIGARAP